MKIPTLKKNERYVIAVNTTSNPPSTEELNDLTETLKPCYVAGVTAHHRGRSKKSNPYPNGSLGHMEWDNGWSDHSDNATREYKVGKRWVRVYPSRSKTKK